MYYYYYYYYYYDYYYYYYYFVCCFEVVVFLGCFFDVAGFVCFLLACLHYISLIYFQVTEDCQEYDVL